MESWVETYDAILICQLRVFLSRLKVMISKFTQQDGKTSLCGKLDRAISCVFCRDLHITLFSSLLQKDLFKGR